MKDDLIVDLFCGGGGTADGVRRALGRGPDISVNHNMHAIAMHKANHPKTHHVCGDVFSVRPSRVVPTGRSPTGTTGGSNRLPGIRKPSTSFASGQ
jgi:DNA (cytosine-5)-methyltransferase 1